MQFVKIFYLIHHTFAPFKITNKNLFFQNFSFSFFSFFFFQKFIFFLFKFFSKMKHLHHTIPRTHTPKGSPDGKFDNSIFWQMDKRKRIHPPTQQRPHGQPLPPSDRLNTHHLHPHGNLHARKKEKKPKKAALALSEVCACHFAYSYYIYI